MSLVHTHTHTHTHCFFFIPPCLHRLPCSPSLLVIWKDICNDLTILKRPPALTSIGHLLKYCAGFEVLVLYLINSCYFTHPPPSFREFTILFYYTILHLPQLHSTPHFSFAYILLITVMHFYINAQYIISASRGLSVHMIHTKKYKSCLLNVVEERT